MNVLLWILIAVVLFAVIGVAVLEVAAAVLWYALVGLVVGAIARLFVRDTGGIGFLHTALAGLAGALLGSVVAGLLDAGGLVSFLLAIVGAALVLAVTVAGDRGDRRAY